MSKHDQITMVNGFRNVFKNTVLPSHILKNMVFITMVHVQKT